MTSILIRISGEAERREELNADVVRLGRHRSNQIVVDHPTVSEHHVVLTRKNDAWYVRDENSTNGTWLNRNRLNEDELALEHGDRLRLGSDRIEIAILSTNQTLNETDNRRQLTVQRSNWFNTEVEYAGRVVGLLKLTPWLRFSAAILGLTAAILSLIWWGTKIFE